MPLNNITLPASCYQLFELLIWVVSFDVFEPADHFDLNISETDPYNDKFDWLGFGSLNIIENMGSILIFILLLIFQSILILIFHLFHVSWDSIASCCRCCRNRTYLKNKFNHWFHFRGYVNSVYRFFLETFIELLICCTISISFKKEIPPNERTFTDSLSILSTYVSLGMLVVFVGIVGWFSLYESNQLYKIKKK